MQKQIISTLIFLLLALPYSVFSASEENEPTAQPPEAPKLESGNNWRLVRSVEIGSSGKFIQLVLIDHGVYTDKTVYSAVINRL